MVTSLALNPVSTGAGFTPSGGPPPAPTFVITYVPASGAAVVVRSSSACLQQTGTCIVTPSANASTRRLAWHGVSALSMPVCSHNQVLDICLTLFQDLASRCWQTVTVEDLL